MTAVSLQQALDAHSDPNLAVFAQRFFKTGPGQYGEGDIFIGLRVPTIRSICKQFRDLPLAEIETLLDSPIHEHRLAAVIIMAEQSKKADASQRQALYDRYLRRSDRVNNWDIIDTSCRDVVGGYLLDKPRGVLDKLARSDNMWERRIAIVTTWEFIRHNQLDDTFRIAEILLGDSHDLIHKATGWMLREAGKRDETALKAFLDKHAALMPRTMLRYSLERLHAADKKHYMSKSQNP